MKTIIHRGSSRGHSNYGWLDTHYTFSFANYYDPSRIHFGALRVINDDIIDGGGGFDKHPHDNMEITTIVLEGTLEHKDSIGHIQQLHPNEVQVMTAGTGIFHSEYNADPEIPVKLFQIWVFPATKNLTPRYDQKAFDPSERNGQWQRLVSPDEAGALLLNQKTWFSRISLSADKNTSYNLHDKSHGAYVFIINGSADVAGTRLEDRDGVGISDASEIDIRAVADADILLIEVPMQW
ncbi:MAG: pirin family protein [Bacteroidetes bacterium]|nr:pirin family protein [Bacteroidota bacterium]